MEGYTSEPPLSRPPAIPGSPLGKGALEEGREFRRFPGYGNIQFPII